MMDVLRFFSFQGGSPVKLTVGRIAASGVVVGLLGLGGAGYAYAQSSTTTPSTTPGTAPSGNGGGHSTANCPNMGGSNSSTSSSTSSGV
jgi:hypothetical protein